MNTIFHGDARDMKEIKTSSVNLVVTSPPYNVGIEYDGDWDDNMHPDAYADFTHDWLKECYRVMAHSARIAINIPIMGNSPRRAKGEGLVPMLPLFVQHLTDNKFTVREIITWVKTHADDPADIEQNFCGCATQWGSWLSPSNPNCRSFSEHIIIAHKGAPKLAWEGQSDLTKEEFLAWTRNVWLMPTAADARHPAPFNVELPRRCIKLYSYVGDTVLDPFMGSGTTALAAKMTQRQYVGYEQSENYITLANNRLENYANAGKKVALL